jgi:hypothetical protein
MLPAQRVRGVRRLTYCRLSDPRSRPTSGGKRHSACMGWGHMSHRRLALPLLTLATYEPGAFGVGACRRRRGAPGARRALARPGPGRPWCTRAMPRGRLDESALASRSTSMPYLWPDAGWSASGRTATTTGAVWVACPASCASGPQASTPSPRASPGATTPHQEGGGCPQQAGTTS